MDRWLADIGDQPNLPERELITQLWRGTDKKPTTAAPTINRNGEQVIISCPTPGASIGYRIHDTNGPKSQTWSVYTNPFTITGGTQVEVLAHRIGYVPSDTISLNL